MTFFEDHGGKLWAAGIGLVVSTGTWLVRTIFTNHKRLDLLEQKQDMQHAQAMKGLNEVRDDVKSIKDANDTAIHTQAEIVKMLKKMTAK